MLADLLIAVMPVSLFLPTETGNLGGAAALSAPRLFYAIDEGLRMQAELRDYQIKALNDLRAAMRAGDKRICMQLPTGAGKTVMAAQIVNMARAKGSRVIFCVPAISLVDQTVKRFEENGIWDIGVIQATHELTDVRKPVQVASIQTLMRREIPKADLVIIDEAHVMFDFYRKWFNKPEWLNVPFVGLSATPWQKGMGRLYQSLIIGTTTQELIDAGHLSSFRCFAADHPDLRGVKTVAGDYETKSLSKAMDQPTLIGDIVSTWLEKAKDLPTLCFGVDRVHAKNIQKQFEAAGIKTAYQDAYTDFQERRQIATNFNNRDVKIVCNVGTLTTGVDWDVRCIILARPTKSEILYTQIIGRGLRTAEGKKDCLILDHSDTTLRLGFVTDIHHDKLDSGEKKAKRETVKPERLPKECSKCKFVKPLRVFECPNCGHKPDPKDNIYSAVGELHEIIRDGKRKPSSWTQKEKMQFYAELLGYCQEKGYKKGWAYHAYRKKFGVRPRNDPGAMPPSPATLSWIRHMNIAKFKMKEKLEKMYDKLANQPVYPDYGNSSPQMASNP